MTRKKMLIGILILAMLALLGSAAFAADAAHGEALAKRWCASCHIVGADQKTASSDAPPFATIAKRAGFNAGAVALFLLDPHPKMPNMSLTRSEAIDLATYIATQAR